jgi:hypothetical protein
MVDDETICGEGLLGDGVITGEESAASPASSSGAPGTTARPAPAYRRMVPQPRPGVGASPIGELPIGFEDLVSARLVMAELGQVARGRQDPQSAAASNRELTDAV